MRFLLSIEEEVLGDNVADMIACSTDKNMLQAPSLNSTPLAAKLRSASMKRFRIYPLSYEALQ